MPSKISAFQVLIIIMDGCFSTTQSSCITHIHYRTRCGALASLLSEPSFPRSAHHLGLKSRAPAPSVSRRFHTITNQTLSQRPAEREAEMSGREAYAAQAESPHDASGLSLLTSEQLVLSAVGLSFMIHEVIWTGGK